MRARGTHATLRSAYWTSAREERHLADRARNAELERYDAVTVGREPRMIELEEKLNALRRWLGEAPDYPLDFGPAGGSDDA